MFVSGLSFNLWEKTPAMISRASDRLSNLLDVRQAIDTRLGR